MIVKIEYDTVTKTISVSNVKNIDNLNYINFYRGYDRDKAGNYPWRMEMTESESSEEDGTQVRTCTYAEKYPAIASILGFDKK